MFAKKPAEKTRLDVVIDRLVADMETEDPNTDKYAAMADQLVKLYTLKESEIPKRVSPDTVALIVGNLAGIALIINHERLNVVTSKALAFAGKLK